MKITKSVHDATTVAGIAILCIAVTLSTKARTFEVAAWRGETVAARVPDFAEMGGTPPAGVEVRYGTIKSVKYAPAAFSLQRLKVFDRVVWNSSPGVCPQGGGDCPRVVEISVSADAKPGTYHCGMMDIRVVDRVLPPPKDWKDYLDLWQHPFAVARVAGAKPFSKEHYAAMKPVWELLATAGQKTITVPIVDLPWDHQCHDAYYSIIGDADFRLFDEYVEFCAACGLGPDIACYSLGPWPRSKAVDPDEMERQWGGLFDRFVAHLKDRGWFDRTVMAMDERTIEDVVAIAKFVRRHAPGMRISMAGDHRPSRYKGIDIDIYSHSLDPRYLNDGALKEAAERAKKGFLTTFYVCGSPVQPNTLMDSGDGEAFWLGAAPAFLELDGFLRWAWNSWPQDPVEDASFWRWRSGDTFLCYPGGEPSWRFLELRNGIVAAEKLRILKESGAIDLQRYGRVSAGYVDLRAALDGRCDFPSVRRMTQDLVNK